MTVQFMERFVKQYERLPKAIQKKVDKSINLLELDFRHPGLRSHPIEGMEDIFEAHVDDKYRMTFERHGNVFLLRNVDNHDECLKNP